MLLAYLFVMSFVHIGVIESCYKQCIGTPRQGMLVPASRACIHLNKAISGSNLDGIEEFSHVWVVFRFHLNSENKVSKLIHEHETGGAWGGGMGSGGATHSGVTPPDSQSPITPPAADPVIASSAAVGSVNVKPCRFFHSKKGCARGDNCPYLHLARDPTPRTFTLSSKITPPMLKQKMGIFATRSPHRPCSVGITLARLRQVDTALGRVYLSGCDLVDGTPVLDIKPYVPYYDTVSPNYDTSSVSPAPDAPSPTGVTVSSWIDSTIRTRNTVVFGLDPPAGVDTASAAANDTGQMPQLGVPHTR